MERERMSALHEAAMFVENRRQELALNKSDCCDRAVDTVLADLRNDLHGEANERLGQPPAADSVKPPEICTHGVSLHEPCRECDTT